MGREHQHQNAWRVRTTCAFSIIAALGLGGCAGGDDFAGVGAAADALAKQSTDDSGGQNDSPWRVLVRDFAAVAAPLPATATVRVLSTGGVASASSTPVAAESPTQAFDQNPATKYLGRFSASGEDWLRYRLPDGGGAQLVSYSITSGNDAPERDPRSWRVLGSNDGVSWATVHTVSGDAGWSERRQQREFRLTAPSEAFRFFQLQFDAIRGSSTKAVAEGTLVQLADWTLRGVAEGALGPALPPAPTPTTALPGSGTAAAETTGTTPTPTTGTPAGTAKDSDAGPSGTGVPTGNVGGGRPARDVPNEMRIANPTGTAVSSVPLQFGRVFAPGKVASCPGVELDGQALAYQADVKNRYPDGSVKFAVFSAVVPSLPAGSGGTLRFFDRGSCPQEAPPDAQGLLAAHPQLDVTVSLDDGTAGVASLRNMISRGSARLWTSGPVSSTWIVEDHAGRQFDFGPDGHRSLRPVFHVQVWHTIGRVRVRTVIEQSDSQKLQNQRYTVTIAGGEAQPATLYRNAAVAHNYGARWTKVFWLDGAAPPSLDMHPNVAYLASTYAVPNYDASVQLAASTKRDLIDNWNRLSAAQKDIFGAGLYGKYMPGAGGRAEIGLFPDWAVWLMYDGDARLWDLVSRNTDLAAAWPMHFREGDARRDFMTTPFVVPGLGRPLSKDGRPALFLYDGNQYMNNPVVNESAPDRLVPVAAVDTNGWVPDCSHQPDSNYLMYLLSGDWWYLEQLQFWASWGLFSTGPNYGWPGRVLQDAELSNQLRGEAWCLRTRARAAWASPDGSPEQTYFTRVTESALRAYEANRVGIATGDPVRVRFARRLVTNNPLHYWSGWEDKGRASAETSGDAYANEASWMYWMMIMTLGHVKELGFGSGEVLSWAAQYQIGMAFAPGSRPEHMADYRTPAHKAVDGNPKFQAWADAFDDWPNWKPAWSGSAEDYVHGYANLATASASFIAAEPGGDRLWSWVYENGYRTRNWAKNPKWAILPR